MVLCEVWKDRNELYNENLDCQRWKQNAAQLEQWLLERERLLGRCHHFLDEIAFYLHFLFSNLPYRLICSPVPLFLRVLG